MEGFRPPSRSSAPPGLSRSASASALVPGSGAARPALAQTRSRLSARPRREARRKRAFSAPRARLEDGHEAERREIGGDRLPGDRSRGDGRQGDAPGSAAPRPAAPGAGHSPGDPGGSAGRVDGLALAGRAGQADPAAALPGGSAFTADGPGWHFWRRQVARSHASGERAARLRAAERGALLAEDYAAAATARARRERAFYGTEGPGRPLVPSGGHGVASGALARAHDEEGQGDVLGQLHEGLEEALDRESYAEAAALRDASAARLAGWWVVRGEDDPAGGLVLVHRAHGRYVARAFNGQALQKALLSPLLEGGGGQGASGPDLGPDGRPLTPTGSDDESDGAWSEADVEGGEGHGGFEGEGGSGGDAGWDARGDARPPSGAASAAVWGARGRGATGTDPSDETAGDAPDPSSSESGDEAYWRELESAGGDGRADGRGRRGRAARSPAPRPSPAAPRDPGAGAPSPSPPRPRSRRGRRGRRRGPAAPSSAAAAAWAVVASERGWDVDDPGFGEPWQEGRGSEREGREPRSRRGRPGGRAAARRVARRHLADPLTAAGALPVLELHVARDPETGRVCHRAVAIVTAERDGSEDELVEVVRELEALGAAGDAAGVAAGVPSAGDFPDGEGGPAGPADSRPPPGAPREAADGPGGLEPGPDGPGRPRSAARGAPVDEPAAPPGPEPSAAGPDSGSPTGGADASESGPTLASPPDPSASGPAPVPPPGVARPDPPASAGRGDPSAPPTADRGRRGGPSTPPGSRSRAPGSARAFPPEDLAALAQEAKALVRLIELRRERGGRLGDGTLGKDEADGAGRATGAEGGAASPGTDGDGDAGAGVPAPPPRSSTPPGPDDELRLSSTPTPEDDRRATEFLRELIAAYDASTAAKRGRSRSVWRREAGRRARAAGAPDAPGALGPPPLALGEPGGGVGASGPRAALGDAGPEAGRPALPAGRGRGVAGAPADADAEGDPSEPPPSLDASEGSPPPERRETSPRASPRDSIDSIDGSITHGYHLYSDDDEGYEDSPPPPPAWLGRLGQILHASGDKIRDALRAILQAHGDAAFRESRDADALLAAAWGFATEEGRLRSLVGEGVSLDESVTETSLDWIVDGAESAEDGDLPADADPEPAGARVDAAADPRDPEADRGGSPETPPSDGTSDTSDGFFEEGASLASQSIEDALDPELAADALDEALGAGRLDGTADARAPAPAPDGGADRDARLPPAPRRARSQRGGPDSGGGRAFFGDLLLRLPTWVAAGPSAPGEPPAPCYAAPATIRWYGPDAFSVEIDPTPEDEGEDGADRPEGEGLQGAAPAARGGAPSAPSRPPTPSSPGPRMHLSRLRLPGNGHAGGVGSGTGFGWRPPPGAGVLPVAGPPPHGETAGAGLINAPPASSAAVVLPNPSGPTSSAAAAAALHGAAGTGGTGAPPPFVSSPVPAAPHAPPPPPPPPAFSFPPAPPPRTPTSGSSPAQDPLSGVFLGAYAASTLEVLQLRRAPGAGGDWISGVKLTGDAHVPCGEVSFRARVAKGDRLPPGDHYPPELGVVGRYRGQGRVAELGYRAPRWVDGELLVFAPNSQAVRGAEAAFMFLVGPRQRYLILLNRLDLGALEAAAAEGPNGDGGAPRARPGSLGTRA